MTIEINQARGKPAGEDEPPGSEPDPPTNEALEQQYDWSRLSNDEWKQLTTIKRELRVLMEKAAVRVVVEGEAQKGLTV